MHHALQSMHDETMYRRSYISCMSVGVGAWWRGGTMGMYISYRINANVHTISYQCECTYQSYRINANVQGIRMHPATNNKHSMMHRTSWITYTLLQKCGVRVNSCHEGRIRIHFLFRQNGLYGWGGVRVHAPNTIALQQHVMHSRSYAHYMRL